MLPPPLAPEKHFNTAWEQYKDTIQGLIRERPGLTVLEVGGGRFPLFAPEEVPPEVGAYIVNDISAAELGRLPAGYRQLHADICSPEIAGGQADLVFSQMVAEHVRDGRAFHANIHRILKPGGVAFHFIPTLYTPPLVLNRLLPERLTHFLLGYFLPERKDEAIPKFPAYYSLCRGPSRRMRRIFHELGYQDFEIRMFYGHGYFSKFPVIRELDDWLTRWAANRDFFWLGTCAFLKVVKPSSK